MNLLAKIPRVAALIYRHKYKVRRGLIMCSKASSLKMTPWIGQPITPTCLDMSNLRLRSALEDI